MKKLMIMAAVMAIAFTSCTTDDQDVSMKEQNQKQISFAGPVMYGMTRAGYTPKTGEIAGTTYPTTERFMVYAKKYTGSFSNDVWGSTATNVFGTISGAEGNGSVDHEEVTYNSVGNGWYTANAYYFLKDYKYAFAAYSPSVISTDFVASQSSSITYDGTGLHVDKYTCPTDLSKHLDFMYAKRVVDLDYNSNLNKSTDGGTNNNENKDYNGVNLVFKHALASVHFRAFVDPEYINQEKKIYKNDVKTGTFNIKSIKIHQVRTSGKFDETIKSQTSTVNYKATPAWTFAKANTLGDYTFLDATGVTTPKAGYVPVYVADGDGGKTISTLSKDATRDIKTLYDGTTNSLGINSESATTKGQYGLMIPQTFTAISGNAPSATIEIIWTHTFRNGSSNNTGGYEMTEVYTTTIDLNKYSQKWEQGKRYIYNIIFKGKLIEFAPQVEDWQEQAGIPPVQI